MEMKSERKRQRQIKIKTNKIRFKERGWKDKVSGGKGKVKHW